MIVFICILCLILVIAIIETEIWIYKGEGGLF